MENTQVILRVDGNGEIGMGHIFRCIALAEMLESTYDILFICSSNSNISPIEKLNFEVLFIPDTISLNDEANWIRTKFPETELLVLDGYQFPNAYQLNVKKQCFSLFYIDDLINTKQVADVIINHCPGTLDDEYQTENNVQLALGLDYALLRKPFVLFDKQGRRRIEKIEKVLISFGGSNPNGFSVKSVDSIFANEFIKEIHVLGGDPEEIEPFKKRGGTRVQLHNGLSGEEIFSLMQTMDLAVVPSSTISVELARLGVPMILGYFIDNQKKIYTAFNKLESIYGVGDLNKFDFGSLNTIINEVNVPEFLNGESLVDLFKSGTQKRFINLFKYQEITIREAELNDLEFLFELTNDPLVRENSFESGEINLDEHTSWFKKQLDSETSILYLLEHKGLQMGQVRFSIHDDHSVIGVSIAKEFRGKGFASSILQKAIDTFFTTRKLPIHAYIKKANTTSINSFERAGFEYSHDCKVKETMCLLFKLERN